MLSMVSSGPFSDAWAWDFDVMICRRVSIIAANSG
jgi:hypothetical protein